MKPWIVAPYLQLRACDWCEYRVPVALMVEVRIPGREPYEQTQVKLTCSMRCAGDLRNQAEMEQEAH